MFDEMLQEIKEVFENSNKNQKLNKTVINVLIWNYVQQRYYSKMKMNRYIIANIIYAPSKKEKLIEEKWTPYRLDDFMGNFML